jgi:hypothetical protein
LAREFGADARPLRLETAEGTRSRRDGRPRDRSIGRARLSLFHNSVTILPAVADRPKGSRRSRSDCRDDRHRRDAAG